MPKAQSQFTKIIINQVHVALHWISRKRTASEADEVHHHQLECPEKPRPEFEKALQAFLPFLLEIIGAPKSWSENTRVTGVSLKKEEDGRRGIVITATRKCPFGSAPIALNTPYLREALDDSKETGSQFFLSGMSDAIDELCAEADKYLGGDRAQGELFGDAKPEKTRGKGGEPEKVGDVVGHITPPKARRETVTT